MQKWEYLWVHVEDRKVLYINGQEVGGWSDAKNDGIPQFLNKMGGEGWEAVGVSPSGHGGSGSNHTIVLLKRPLERG
jgi:hypothetical protein